MLTQEQKDNVSKLITALRSGEYAQGKGALCEREVIQTPDGECVVTNKVKGYCCLGVAAKVLGIADKEMRQFRVQFPSFINLTTGSYLPAEVAEKFGFEPQDQQELARMNDQPVPFFAIASYLERWAAERA